MFKIIFLLSLFGLFACSFESEQSQYIKSPDMYMVKAQYGFDFLYDSGATKMTKDYYQSGVVVINGSYFGITQSGSYYPAGYWEVHGDKSVIQSIGTEGNPLYDDPNITDFVVLSGEEMKIFPNSKFKENDGSYDLAFQAGPLVLSGNLLQDFGKSWHAHELHERTLIGKTQNGKIYFFVFIKPITLDEVGVRISRMNLFQNDPITLLNMDGGPSTSYYDGKNGFRIDAKLPIMVVIRK